MVIIAGALRTHGTALPGPALILVVVVVIAVIVFARRKS
jgi:hypothetical protein